MLYFTKPCCISKKCQATGTKMSLHTKCICPYISMDQNCPKLRHSVPTVKINTALKT